MSSKRATGVPDEETARRRLWALSHDLYVVIGKTDGSYRLTNPAWETGLGYPDGSLIGRRFDELSHPDDLGAVSEIYESLVSTGTLSEFEMRMRAADGSHRWYRWSGFVDGDDVICYGRDVHETKLREQELAKRASEADRIWRSTMDLYVTLGKDGRYKSANPAWKRLLGHPPVGLIGREFNDLVHPDDRDRNAQAWGRMLEGGRLNDHEVRLLTADGAWHWTSWTVFADGDVFAAVGRDIEERRAREEDLRQAEQAVRQLQKLELIGQLTGGVAHDFNNLLAAIRSSLELLGKRLPPDDQRASALLENAVSGTQRGAVLTQRMLAFARKQELLPQSVDLSALVAGMSDLMARSVGPNVLLHRRLEGDLPNARVDPNQMEMALLNLVVNASDAMDGDGEITIKLSETSLTEDGVLRPGRYLALAVTDTGGGMDAATLAKATEPFFTTKGAGKGTGLGLSMVHGLARQSEGHFDIESAPGTGTTATIWLPVTDAEAAAAPEPPPAGPRDEAARPLKVLAVDDDVLVLMGTVGMLEELGHTVIEAHSGARAMEVAAGHADIDLLVTDQSMPRMTGLELLARLREDRGWMPAILATGYADLPEEADRAGVVRLDKPFGERELSAAIGAVMAG